MMTHCAITSPPHRYNCSFVSVPPSNIRLIPSSELPVREGTLVSFNCTSERVYPNPIFEWYKNDEFLQRFVLFFLFSFLINCIFFC